MGVHDSGYKQLFSFPTMVEDLLRGFVREPWVGELDFSTLERKNGSYVADDLREREDDIIWRVKWQGQESWMYIYTLLEFQQKRRCQTPSIVTCHMVENGIVFCSWAGNQEKISRGRGTM